MAEDRTKTVLVWTDQPHRWDSSVTVLPAPDVAGSALNPSVYAYAGVLLDIRSQDLRQDQLFRLRGYEKFYL